MTNMEPGPIQREELERDARILARQQVAYDSKLRTMLARRESVCPQCKGPIAVGAMIARPGPVFQFWYCEPCGMSLHAAGRPGAPGRVGWQTTERLARFGIAPRGGAQNP